MQQRTSPALSSHSHSGHSHFTFRTRIKTNWKKIALQQLSLPPHGLTEILNDPTLFPPPPDPSLYLSSYSSWWRPSSPLSVFTFTYILQRPSLPNPIQFRSILSSYIAYPSFLSVTASPLPPWPTQRHLSYSPFPSVTTGFTHTPYSPPPPPPRLHIPSP